MYRILIVLSLLLIITSCNNNIADAKQRVIEKEALVKSLNKKLNKKVNQGVNLDSLINLTGRKLITKDIILNTRNLDSFVNIRDLSDDFLYDIKYATSDNFAKKPVYDCEACYVRLKTALALLKANNTFMNKGYKIKFFDCYRPFSVQEALWKSYPNPNYLSNPKQGSIHNRGGAVDITLVDINDNELDMGTPFDYFGKEAHRTFKGHTPEVLKNREILTKTMTKNGFWTIRTEWWHFNHGATSRNTIENFKWSCD